MIAPTVEEWFTLYDERLPPILYQLQKRLLPLAFFPDEGINNGDYINNTN